MNESTRVLFCNCTYSNVVPPQVKQRVLESLCASGVAFDAVPDLCEMSARKDPLLRQVAESADVRIAACFPRAVRWLFQAGEAPLSDGQVRVLNMREQDAGAVVAGLFPEPPPPGRRRDE